MIQKEYKHDSHTKKQTYKQTNKQTNKQQRIDYVTSKHVYVQFLFKDTTKANFC